MSPYKIRNKCKLDINITVIVDPRIKNLPRSEYERQLQREKARIRTNNDQIK